MKYCKHFVLGLLIIVSACSKIKYYPDRELPFTETKILGHRGGGNYSGQTNTLAASVIGFNRFDGIEVDIQISKEQTLWLSHNANFENCGNMVLTCFPETNDAAIVQLDSCLGVEHSFSRLEEIFIYMKENYPQSYISLDVKPWEPCNFTSAGITGMMRLIGDRIIALTNTYGLNHHIMVESEVTNFLTYVKKNSDGIETYLGVLGDFERGMMVALENGYSGISFKYKFDEEITTEHIYLLHKKGLKIQLWTIGNQATLEEAMALRPDFIQSELFNQLESSENKFK